ncbi:hypothetical protein GON22_25300 [Paenibacillus sp. MMS18-CY102]|nr:hypothetical protein [Paenibacillus sp. MMS18-CY102]
MMSAALFVALDILFYPIISNRSEIGEKSDKRDPTNVRFISELPTPFESQEQEMQHTFYNLVNPFFKIYLQNKL